MAPLPGLSALLAVYAILSRSEEHNGFRFGSPESVAAMIPALNEEETIPYALTSLASQTITPDPIVVVDDGSTDDTLAIVRAFADALDVTVEIRRHEEPLGKTVGVKEVARSLETDMLLVLDADTFLEDRTYIERLLARHEDPSVASAYGTVRPATVAAKQSLYLDYARDLLPADSVVSDRMCRTLMSGSTRTGPLAYLTSNKPVVQLRTVTFAIEQRFFKRGFMRLFDSTLFPVGCAVLYEREKLVSVFDYYEDSLGNNLTDSEDIFVGFAFCDRGWKNVYVPGADMRSDVPGFRGAIKQNVLWGSGFLQSAFYFRRLTQRFRRQRVPTLDGTDTVRQPMGRAILARLADGLYPTTLLVLLALALAGVVSHTIPGMLLLWEFTLYFLIGAAVASDRSRFVRCLVPCLCLRFLMLPVLTYTYTRFLTDLVTGNRNWRK